MIARLVSGPLDNSEEWEHAFGENRDWVKNLSDTDKDELKRYDNYGNWHPGLIRNDPITINGVLRLFPNISGSEAIPYPVWKYENPASPDKLPGAVDIDAHDAIHSLLGRGALMADEAFVIGFTMGRASGELTQDHIETYIHAFTTEYEPPYRIKPDYISSYLLAVEAGRAYFEGTGIDLSKTDFSSLRDKPISELRDIFQIDINWLSMIYTRLEAEMVPYTKSPQRNAGPVDPRRIRVDSPRVTLG